MKKRKDGYYKVTKIIDGKRHYFYGRDKDEAKAKRDKYIGKKNSVLFKDVAEEWWEFHSSSLAFNSLRGLKPAYDRAVKEFGEDEISSITPSDLAKYIKRFTEKGYADKTTRTQLGVFNMIFKYAINYKNVNMANPARDVIIPRGLPKEKVTLPSDADIKKVKDNVDTDFGLFAYMAMYTGMRRGELLALKWDDIRDGYITVDKSIYYNNNVPHIKTPKTDRSIRRIPVLDKLSPYLTGKKGIIFNVDGKYMPQHIFDRKWKEYCMATGITCTPHQLRHCFATMLYEANVPAKDAQFLLGHSQLSTTMDIYTDIRKQRENDIAESIKSIDIGV